MRLPTRNQLHGTITEGSVGPSTASVKVRLDGGDQVVTASITKETVEELGLEAGKSATVLITSTRSCSASSESSVLIGVVSPRDGVGYPPQYTSMR